uniref:Uncharacterized protein n=1 Tax=Rhodnius prolixus TaxID=13249 RepID=T1I6X7_RHOPR
MTSDKKERALKLEKLKKVYEASIDFGKSDRKVYFRAITEITNAENKNELHSDSLVSKQMTLAAQIVENISEALQKKGSVGEIWFTRKRTQGRVGCHQ